MEVLIEGGEDVDGKGQDGATPLRLLYARWEISEIIISTLQMCCSRGPCTCGGDSSV